MAFDTTDVFLAAKKPLPDFIRKSRCVEVFDDAKRMLILVIQIFKCYARTSRIEHPSRVRILKPLWVPSY